MASIRRVLPAVGGCRASTRIVAALESQEHDPEQEIGGRSLGDWLIWAHEQLEKYDPTNAGGLTVFGNIASVVAWTCRD